MVLIDKGKFISKMTRFYGSIFALQFDNNGRTVGYASEYLKKALPYLDAIITDNNQFVYDAFREFDLPANQKSKFKVIYNPSRVKVEENKYPIIKHNDLKLLWAGRIDKEKYPDLIKHIIDFDNRVSVDMYGSTVVDSQSPIKASERLHLMGPFLDISDIKDICKYDAFIFTSKWEGLPNILLEIASLGLPIIAPDVGGVPELINSNTGFLVHGSRNVSGYLDAIMSIREDPAEAIRRSRNLQEVIKNRHSWQQFIENVLRIQDYV
jgi:glycosyltransferase involved in cell wall biosynthesis